MKEFTKIERSFWETDEARDMTPEEKYFWMYLQTNANVNTLGCYPFRMRRAIDETGYNRETMEKLLFRMVELGRIVFDQNTAEVFLPHFSRDSWNKKNATVRAIRSDLKEVRSALLREHLAELLQEAGIEPLAETAENAEGQECTPKIDGDAAGGFAKQSADKGTNGYNGVQAGTNGDNGVQVGTTGYNRGEKEEGEEEKEKNKKETVGAADRPTPKRFTPPTLEEVRAYCRERNNRVDAERFIDFYAAKGWMIGKNKMKDWKAAIRTWERQNKQDAEGSEGQRVAHGQGAAAENAALLERRRLMMGG